MISPYIPLKSPYFPPHLSFPSPRRPVPAHFPHIPFPRAGVKNGVRKAQAHRLGFPYSCFLNMDCIALTSAALSICCPCKYSYSTIIFSGGSPFAFRYALIISVTA